MGISLLSSVGKVYGRLLIKRIRDGIEGVVCEEQCGFRRGQKCVDQEIIMRQVSEIIFCKKKISVLSFYGLGRSI